MRLHFVQSLVLVCFLVVLLSASFGCSNSQPQSVQQVDLVDSDQSDEVGKTTVEQPVARSEEPSERIQAEQPPINQTEQIDQVQSSEIGESATESPVVRSEEPAQPVQAPPLDDADESVVELRVWQPVNDPLSIWVRGWLEGQEESGSTRELVEMPCGLIRGDYTEGRQRYGLIRIRDSARSQLVFDQGAVLFLLQQEDHPERILIQACSGECLGNPCPIRAERHLGMTVLEASDDTDGDPGIRVANLRIVVPRNNPGLLRDREHLLALRDVLEGGAVELDWSVSTPTTNWEGVTVSGSPPRVSGLNLSGRGLAGELWGYIGDLTELTELRLDGNRLSGILPSKMQLLSKLSIFHLAGNQLEGCAPPSLWSVDTHDLGSAGLPQCPDLIQARSSFPWLQVQVSSYFLDTLEDPHFIVLELPLPGATTKTYFGAGATCYWDNGPEDFFEEVECGVYTGFAFRHAQNDGIWLFLSTDYGQEIARSHFNDCVYDCVGTPSPAAWIEQLAASVWVNELAEYDFESDKWIWTWP